MNKLLMILLLTFTMSLFCDAQRQQVNPVKAQHIDSSDDFVPGIVLVKFRDDVQVKVQQTESSVQTGINSFDILLSKYRFSACTKVFQNETPSETDYAEPNTDRLVQKVPELFNIYLLQTSIADIRDIADSLELDPNVEYAEPDFYVHALGNLETVPNDPLYPQQPWLVTINAPAAWDSVTGDSTQVIGIVDTGVDWTHPDLVQNIWINEDEIPANNYDDDQNGYVDDIRGWDFINNDNNPADDNSHGTHVAGIAAARGNNGTGITGVAWNARIMPVKILQSSGTGTTSGVALAVNYAANNGATVINLSLGYYYESLTLKAALENAYSSAVLVAAAGNDGYCICEEDGCIDCNTMFPAAYPFILGVMANGAGTGFSNWDATGPTTVTQDVTFNYEITAPGGNILSTLPYGTYGTYSGTSMAAPMVSGAVALMKGYDPDQSTETLFCRLIQGSSGGTLNIFNSLDPELQTELSAVNLVMYDTMPGCNNNGLANQGEHLNYSLTVINTGGLADSVHVTMTLQNLADTVYAAVLDSTSYLGDISPYASIPSSDPLVLAIDTITPHNAKIGVVFEIKAANAAPFFIIDTLSSYRTDLIHGYLDTILVLTPERRWLVYPWLVIRPTGKIILEAGAEMEVPNSWIGCDPGSSIILKPGSLLHIVNPSGIHVNNAATFTAIGEPDSMITFSGGGGIFGGNLVITNAIFLTARVNNSYTATFDHCQFYNCGLPFTAMWQYYKFYDCLFSGCFFQGIDGPGPIERCNFINCSGYLRGAETNYCNFSQFNDSLAWTYMREGAVYVGNNFLTRPDRAIYQAPAGYVLQLPPNYWGTIDTVLIDSKIYDFWENPANCIVRYSPILTQPSPIAHGIVWRVLVNGQDLQDATMEPLGEGLARFDVCFNRAIDTACAPLLTFSAWEPYTHRHVTDSASWSADSTVWTAYYNITKETGDGINTIKVSGCKDSEGWDVPPEFNNRFCFVIQAASSASIEFIAIAGLNKVNLEWPPVVLEDHLGYNLYRFAKNGETIVADTTLLNSSPIMDTIYTDTNMAIGPTYYYFYRILGTDLRESDNSKIISALPYLAAEGDANGDLSVDVLDVTAVIYKILGQSPYPFFLYAADVNDDNNVDILDIVGIVNIISGSSRSAGNHYLPGSNTANAYLSDSKLFIRSDGNISALYFEVDSESDLSGKIVLNIAGFELASDFNKGRLQGIIYSLDNRTIPAGLLNIVTFKGSHSDLELPMICGSDPGSKLIRFDHRDPADMDMDALMLNAHPNPFLESVLIDFFLPADAEAAISFYNSTGQQCHQIPFADLKAGLHQIEWNLADHSPGIYYCVLTVRYGSGKTRCQTVKLVSVSQ